MTLKLEAGQYVAKWSQANNIINLMNQEAG